MHAEANFTPEFNLSGCLSDLPAALPSTLAHSLTIMQFGLCTVAAMIPQCSLAGASSRSCLLRCADPAQHPTSRALRGAHMLQRTHGGPEKPSQAAGLWPVS